jgi:hypothetical protein
VYIITHRYEVPWEWNRLVGSLTGRDPALDLANQKRSAAVAPNLSRVNAAELFTEGYSEFTAQSLP